MKQQKHAEQLELKPIPTPRSYQRSNSGYKVFYPHQTYSAVLLGEVSERFSYCGIFLKENLADTFSMHLDVLSRGEGEVTWNEDIIICSNPSLLSEDIVEEEDRKLFTTANAEQSYVIKCMENGPILILATTDIGCLYGVATLLQLCKGEKAAGSNDLAKISIHHSVTRDYPDFKYRGNMWTIWGEMGVWSYDRGDGIEAYKQRIISKLELMLKHKVNLVYIDAFGFDTERFPEYAELLRSLNREARLRGIRLATGSYTMGYGMIGTGDVYRGEAFKNQKSYPDGEEYPCMGLVVDDPEFGTGQIYGTCLSNKELMKLKMAELKRFVTEVEPGALYLHSLDTTRLSHLDWSCRCSECRKKWPDDNKISETGAAGAFAYLFDQIAETVNSVKKDGYDAAKDCSIIFISPGYMTYLEKYIDDSKFIEGATFWTTISKKMKHKENVTFMFRELFLNSSDNDFRCKKLHEAMLEEGNGHALGIIWFCGADGFKSDQLFQVTSLLSYAFEGCDLILNANGHAFQEPLQLLNAEYMWNSKNSGFYNLENKPEKYQDFVAEYNRMMKTECRPEGIYGEGGFLEIACCHLYGNDVGRKMAEVFKLKGENFEPPVAYSANVDMLTGRFKVVFPMRWDNILNREEIEGMLKRFKQLFHVSSQAKRIVDDVLTEEGLSGEAANEIRWLSQCFDVGVRQSGFLVQYMNMYQRLDDYFAAHDSTTGNDRIVNLDEVRSEIDKFISEVRACREEIEQWGLTPIDSLGGALVRRIELFDFLEYNLGLMDNSVHINHRMPNNRKELPSYNWW